MWEQITYDIKCPRRDCAYAKTDAGEHPCAGCTCNRKAEGTNRAFRYKPTGMPERKEKKDEASGRHQEN